MTRKRKMFYSAELLSLKSKTNISTIYYASSCKKRLSKKEMEKIDLSSTIDNIKHPMVPFSLRLYSFFLRGIVRLYVLKIKYAENEFKSFLSMLNQSKRSRKINLTIYNGEDLRLRRIFNRFLGEKVEGDMTQFVDLERVRYGFDDNDCANDFESAFEHDQYLSEDNLNLSLNNNNLFNNYFKNELINSNLNSSDLRYRGNSSTEINQSLSKIGSTNSSTISEINKTNKIKVYEKKYDYEIDLNENEGYLSSIYMIRSKNVDIKEIEKNNGRREGVFAEIELLIKRMKMNNTSYSPLVISNNLNDDFSGESYKIDYNNENDNIFNINNINNSNDCLYDEVNDHIFMEGDSFLSLVKRKPRKMKVLCFYKLLCLCSAGSISALQCGEDIKYTAISNSLKN